MRLALQLVQGLLLVTVLAGWPLAWILRDGLGPDARETAGVEAVLRAAMTFYVGPISLTLAIIALGLQRYRRRTGT